jgi:uncharacterized protein (DUF849 family)
MYASSIDAIAKTMSSSDANAERSARVALIWDAFTQYMQALLEFFAAVEQCAVKGWPDRITELRAATRAQQLYCDQELARLKHTLAVDSECTLNSYTDFAPIFRRLREDWTTHDEEMLLANSPVYVSIQTEIRTMRRLSTELDGAIEMAKRDPELRSAAQKLKQTTRVLQERLHHGSESSGEADL